MLKTLIDTGLHITIVSAKHKSKFKQIRKPEINVVTANITSLENYGFVYSDIIVQGKIYKKAKIYIADIRNYDMIIGADCIMNYFKNIKVPKKSTNNDKQSIVSSNEVFSRYDPVK